MNHAKVELDRRTILSRTEAAGVEGRRGWATRYRRQRRGSSFEAAIQQTGRRFESGPLTFGVER